MTLETITIVSGGQEFKIPARSLNGMTVPLVESRPQSGGGFERVLKLSAPQTFTIANGANGSAVTPVDLGANYESLVVTCTDCQYIAATTTMSAVIGLGPADTLCTLYAKDDPSSAWATGNLPTSGTLAFGMTYPFAVRRIRLVLSNNASGGSVVFNVYGLGMVENMASYEMFGESWEELDINWEDME